MIKLYLLIFILFLSGCGDQLGMGLMNSASSSGHHHEIETEAELETKQFVGKKTVLADRVYLSSVLENVFLPFGDQPLEKQDQTVASTIKQYVAQRSSAFGGPCFKNDEAYQEGKIRLCSESTSNLETNPNSSVSRQGFKVKACEALVANNRAITNAVLKNFEVIISPNRDGIEKAYQQFYPSKKLQQSDALVFSELVAKIDENKPLDQWRLVYLALCQSNEWEIL